MVDKMYEELNRLVEENKKRLSKIDIDDTDTKVVSVNDLFLQFEDKSRYSIDDTDIVIPKIKKILIKLFGTFNNILVTEVYPEGIPKSVRDNLSSKVYRLQGHKKDYLKVADKQLQEAKSELRKLQAKYNNPDEHIAGQFDNLIQPILNKITELEHIYSGTQKEVQFLSMLKTNINAGEEKTMGHILHTKVILALLHTVKKIYIENLSFDQVMEQKLLGEEKETAEKLYGYISELIKTDEGSVLDIPKDEYSKLLYDCAELDLEGHKNEAAMFAIVATNMLHMIVDMFDIELIKPPIMKEFEKEEDVPADRKDEWKKAVQFINNQARNYINEIIEGRYPKYKITSEKSTTSVPQIDKEGNTSVKELNYDTIEQLKEMLNFTETWSSIEMLTELDELKSTLEASKKSIISKFDNSIATITKLIFEHDDVKSVTDKEKRIVELLIYCTTKAEGIYRLLILL